MDPWQATEPAWITSIKDGVGIWHGVRKCKNEYREGITVCPDCGETLVSEEETDGLDFRAVR